MTSDAMQGSADAPARGATDTRGRDRWWLVVVLALHLGLVIPLAAVLNVWIDEAYTLKATGAGIADAVQRALKFELQPPLYYVLLTVWRKLDAAPFFARMFSVACTFATILLAYAAARRYLRETPAALIAALVAFNPITVYVAVEARYYAFVLLLSSCLVVWLHDAYFAGKPTTAARAKYMLVAVASLYTYYFLGFLLFAGLLATALLRPSQVFRACVRDNALAACAFAPLAWVVVQQVGEVRAGGVSERQGTRASATHVWQLIWRYLLPVESNGELAPIRAWISRLAIPALIVAAVVRRRGLTAPMIVLATLVGSVATAFALICMMIGAEFAKPQHIILLLLPVVLLASSVVERVGGGRAAVGVGVVGLLFSGINLVETYRPLAKQGDWIRVSQFIQENEQHGEPILVFKAEFVLDFGFHYRGKNLLVPVPRSTDSERYSLRDQVLSSQAEVAQILRDRLGEPKRFWLVTSHTGPFRGVDPRADILERFLAVYCEILVDRKFVASRVRLVHLRGRIDSLAGNVERDDWTTRRDNRYVELFSRAGVGATTNRGVRRTDRRDWAQAALRRRTITPCAIDAKCERHSCQQQTSVV